MEEASLGVLPPLMSIDVSIIVVFILQIVLI
jgi:hypothetical protein